jgi:glucose-6-phosphate dehydrogenase assembly protein OpcA
MPDASNVERFSRGEAISVEVDRIERELATLWKTAGRTDATSAAPDAPPASVAVVPLARASLWNIVVTAHGSASLERIKTLVDDLTQSIPARVIVLNQAGGGGGDRSLRATIESNVVSRPGGARTVYSEEITLTGSGGGEEHFGALVRSLLIPSLPTATFWIDSTVAENLLTRELLPVAERLVVDTGQCTRARDLGSVYRLTTQGTPVVADLGWLRLASFRTLFAGLFDPPIGGGPLADAHRVIIHHHRLRVASAVLLSAWLGTQLGWEPLGADPEQSGGLHLRFRRAASEWATAADDVTVDLVPSDGECGTSGIVSLEMLVDSPVHGDEERYGVSRTGGNHAELTIPIAPPRSIKLDSRSDAELCASALGPQGRDPLLRRCLAYAARLSDLVDGPGRG